MNLEEIRANITSIDEKIIDLIQQRFAMISDIIEEKQKTNIPTFQPARENQMHREYWSMAINRKLNPELIRQIFELIISEMRTTQEKLIKGVA